VDSFSALSLPLALSSGGVGAAGLTLVAALVAGVFAQCFARQLRIPGIVVLLAVGAVMGPDVLALIDPHALGGGLFVAVDIAVAVILFEGGMKLETSRLKKQESAIRKLITVGAAVTFLGASLAAWWLLESFGLKQALIFGSLVVVTGPTVIGPLLRDMRLRPRIKTILEAEGVLIDPVGAILAVLVLQIALGVHADAPLTESVQDVVQAIGFGIGGGMLGGFLMVGLLRSRMLVPRGFENIAALALVLLIFFGCDAIVTYSGILAVTIAGIVVGNMPTRSSRELAEFKDQLTIMLVGLLFVLLAADVRFANIQALGWGGAAVVGVLVLVVRPLSVWASTRGSGLTPREQVFIAGVAPRGIVAAAIATITANRMAEVGANGEPLLAGGEALGALVFLTIACTVVLTGFTAKPLASVLRLRMPTRDRVAILGGQGLGLALGGVLREGGRHVVFLDADPNRVKRAEEAGFEVVRGDALDEATMARGQFELVGTAVGLTSNEHLNILFCERARDLFDVPNRFVAVTNLEGGEAPKHIAEHEADVFSKAAHDVARWDVRARTGGIVVERVVYSPEPLSAEAEEAAMDERDEAAAGTGSSAREELWVMLAWTRDGKTRPVTLGWKPQPGDVVAVALHEPTRERALSLLQDRDWLDVSAMSAAEEGPVAEDPADEPSEVSLDVDSTDDVPGPLPGEALTERESA
jgi:NhaP-type Na+/H+ or K+/H+ antiporter